MADGIRQGMWLLIDAAGPVSVVGLLDKRGWLASRRSEGDFLELLDAGISSLLSEYHFEFRSLNGVLYASGPGSTLGLRLAALYIRSLLELPELQHWCCYQYHNLEVAICSQWTVDEHVPTAAVAPWRRDRLHRSRWQADSVKFENDSIAPMEATVGNMPGFSLGKRHPGNRIEVHWKDYPIEKIPATLNLFPWLLRKTTQPIPYSAEAPQFVQWNPTRHSAK